MKRYVSPGLYKEADGILALAPDEGDPMAHYYRYACTGNRSQLEKAEGASPRYCFPNRIEEIGVLENAINSGGEYAKYYLGCLLYDKQRWEESVSLWESCADHINLPTVYRNLALAYYNKMHDADRARAAMEKAFEMDKRDARSPIPNIWERAN